MNKTVKEFEGKTVEEAIETGLNTLGIHREDAEITVLEEGKKKLFSRVNAKVSIAYEEKEEVVCAQNSEEKTDGERAVEFTEGLLKIMNQTASVELVKEDEKIVINVTAANTNAVIGKRGAVLDSIQTLASAVANIGRDDYKRVVVDCENYRENREETLKKLAENLANKAVRMERKIRLEAMNPYERRIIHAALTEREDVTTKSEGKEPNRYIVVVPNNESDPSLPALPAREERRENKGGRGGFNGRKGSFNKRGFGERRNDRPQRSAPKKQASDFFGTFLGNSKDSQE